MATGGGRQFMKPSTDPGARRSWQRTTSASDKEDNISINSIPNDLRPNNWDFSDWKPNPTTLDNSKRRKKGNPEREREQSLSQDSPPSSERNKRTPSTYPRTRITPSTPTSQRLALENLKQRMTFSDDASNDGERNNERNIPSRRPKLENYARQDTSSAEGARSLQDEGEHGHIVSRLMQIREYIKQTNSVKDALWKSGNPIDLGKATKLKHVIESLREQETGYLEILRDFGIDKENGGLMDANNREESPLNPESVEDNYSLDFEVQSETSEASSISVDNNPRGAKRPRIEDKLGLTNGDEEDDNTEYQLVAESFESDTMENTLIGRLDRSADFDADNDVRENEDLDEVRKNELKALRQQQELLKKLIHQQEQMRQLKGRQAALLALQKDAEQKLAEAKSRDNQVRHNLSDSNQNLTTNPAEDGFPTLSESRRLVTQSVDNNPLTSRNTGGDRELQEILHHLNILKKEQNLETAERQSNPELEASAALEDNRKQLQDKLLDLQEKKQRMDSLLQELQNLRKQRDSAILNNGMPPEAEEATALMAASMAAMAEQTDILNEADNNVSNQIDMLDAQGKLEKLQEVKERLNQLRSLVSYYQTASQSDNPPEMDEKAAFLAQLEMGQDEMEINIRPEDVLDSITEGGAIGGTTIKSDEDNCSEDSRTTESHLSSLGPWGDDPEIQEKVRKLKDAKQKLKQLQDLVSRVQQSPDAGRVLPDLSELAACLENPVMSQAEERPMSEGEVPMTLAEREYESKLQEQLRELNELQSERQRLLTLQQELQSFQSISPEREHQAAPSQKKPATKKLIKQPPQPVEDEDSGQDKEPQRPARPNPPVVKFSSNDEVYGKMRKQRMLREELRQKKRELEAIMKKEKKNYSKNQDNQSDTVSYSTDMYGASMSADATMATWGGSTVDNLESITEDNDQNDKDDEDEDDAYPSDGIIQVEEEEEENDSDNNTYTIEDDVRQRRQARSRRQPQDREMKRRTFPRGQKQPKDGTKPKQAWSKYSRRQRRQENYRSAQELMEDDEQDDSKQMESPNSTYEVLQQQLHRTASLCKTLMDDQGQQSMLQTSSLASPPGYGYRPQGQMPDFFQQLQQQQLMMNLSQCLQQMSVQQLEIRNLQRQMSGLTLQPDLTDRGSTLAVVSDDLRMRSMTSLPTVGDSRGLSPNVLPRPDSFSMQPQFPSNFATRRSADNLLSAQTMDDNVFDTDELSSQQIHKTSLQNLDTRSRQDQYMLPRGASQPTGSQRRQGLRRPDQRGEESSIPPLNLQQRKKKKSSSQQTHPTWTNLSDQREGKDMRRHTGEILTGLAERGQGSRGHERPERPGLSAGISGEGFGENSSMVSSVSSRPQGADAPRSKRETRVEEDNGDLTLFEALRESIYSEVATLISQNESRPHFLIELFKELQLLSSDYLRQRALYSIRDIVSKFLTDQQNRMNSVPAPLPAWMNSEVVGNCTASELTPSESILTSDEEEIKRQIKDLTAAEKRLFQRTGMTMDSNTFDYAENADNDSSLSTPSNNYWDHPFAQDSLGDTAIRLDEALKRMKEMEVNQEQRGTKYQNSAEPSPVGRPLSEPTSSSAVDQGSESSAASLSYSRIDTEHLNQQIKTIMKEIIPVIKEHLDNVCSSQLLDYIKRLVLSLTRQYDSSQCATFFHTQLGSALQDTLAKFEGRKLRVCGEDLLVDMSEVLFNELAFFRLMQGLGETPNMAANKQQRTSSTQTKDEVTEVYDPSEDLSQESETSETTDTETEEDPSANTTSIHYNAAEEEELGKSRDDEFASEIVLDGDDNDDKKSPVQIQLAVSETKPFTRIGSDEDDEDADESQSADDPSETAVARDAMMEKSQSNDDGNSVEVLNMNGEVVENGEVTIDDLPESLNITPNTENIQAKMQEEQQTNEGPDGVLNESTG